MSATTSITRVDLPELHRLEPEPMIPVEVYERRQHALRQRMHEAGLDALVVYADREHFANSSYLTGFDPRFEEALVLLDADSVTILAGNESISLVADLPGAPSGVLCQAFSLPGQDRSISDTIPDALAHTSLARSARVGVVGWKPVPDGGIAVPQFVLAGLEQHVGSGWQDVTEWFGGLDGARTWVGADQLALHEHRATRASRHVWRALESLAVGMSELDVSEAMRLTGLQQACNVMCTSGATTVNGLRSATDRVLAHGDRVSMAVGLWGGLASRAGWLVTHDEPGLEAYVERVAAPYMATQRLWYESLHIGASTGAIAESVVARLAEVGLRSQLNPGHFVHLDEWVNSPFVAGSTMAVRSGMALQWRHHPGVRVPR